MPASRAALYMGSAPYMFPWSVMPTAGWPSESAAATTSPIRDAPSSIEYSVCRCRWTNESCFMSSLQASSGRAPLPCAPPLSVPPSRVWLSTGAGEFPGENYTAVIRPKVAPDRPAVDRWQDAPMRGHGGRDTARALGLSALLGIAGVMHFVR